MLQTRVGYDSVGLLKDGQAKGVGASFFKIDNSGLTLGDLQVTGYGAGEGGDTGVYCQLLDGSGRSLGIDYFWYDDGVKGEGKEGEDWWYGWYNSDSDIPYNDTPLPAGEGIWVFSPDEKFTIQCAGAVPGAPVSVTLRANGEAKLVINPMPVNLTFGDMWVSGYGAGEGGDTGVYCQLLDGSGRSLGIDYFWYDDGVKGEGKEGEDWWYGWYNSDSDIPYNDTPLPAGTGVWMFSPDTKFTANFKSPIQKEVE